MVIVNNVSSLNNMPLLSGGIANVNTHGDRVNNVNNNNVLLITESLNNAYIECATTNSPIMSRNYTGLEDNNGNQSNQSSIIFNDNNVDNMPVLSGDYNDYNDLPTTFS